MLGLVFDVLSLANDKKINDFLEVNLIWLFTMSSCYEYCYILFNQLGQLVKLLNNFGTL
jgi:hypothetical protein